jgi:hypothetical protein
MHRLAESLKDKNSHLKNKMEKLGGFRIAGCAVIEVANHYFRKLRKNVRMSSANSSGSSAAAKCPPRGISAQC